MRVVGPVLGNRGFLALDIKGIWRLVFDYGFYFLFPYRSFVDLLWNGSVSDVWEGGKASAWVGDWPLKKHTENPSKCPLLKSQVPTAGFGFPRPRNHLVRISTFLLRVPGTFTSAGTSSAFSESNQSSRCNDKKSWLRFLLKLREGALMKYGEPATQNDEVGPSSFPLVFAWFISPWYSASWTGDALCWRWCSLAERTYVDGVAETTLSHLVTLHADLCAPALARILVYFSIQSTTQMHTHHQLCLSVWCCLVCEERGGTWARPARKIRTRC